MGEEDADVDAYAQGALWCCAALYPETEEGGKEKDEEEEVPLEGLSRSSSSKSEEKLLRLYLKGRLSGSGGGGCLGGAEVCVGYMVVAVRGVVFVVSAVVVVEVKPGQAQRARVNARVDDQAHTHSRDRDEQPSLEPAPHPQPPAQRRPSPSDLSHCAGQANHCATRQPHRLRRVITPSALCFLPEPNLCPVPQAPIFPFK